MTKNNSQITIKTLFQNIKTSWSLILIVSIFGALISFILSQTVIKPLYISKASISVGINFKEIGHLSQYEQDQYIGLVESIFLSDELADQVISDLTSKGININIETFKTNRDLDRQNNYLIFKYTSKDKDLPQEIVTTWVNLAYITLDEAYEHALTTQKYIDLQNASLNCYQGMIQYNSDAICENLLLGLPESTEILKEKALSKGIFPGLVYSLTNKSGSAPITIRNQTNILVLSGFFVGLISALIFVIFIQSDHE